jgi:DNA ligase (NAD+)
LFAIGIRYVGETVAKTLASRLKSIEVIENATAEALTQVGEIGEVIAGSIQRFFSEQRNREMIDRLKDAGLQLSATGEPAVVSQKLANLSFVISGVFQRHSREEIQKLVEDYGGKNLSSVSSNTSYIIAGEGMGPSKKEKALKLGIPMITEDEFLAMIQ